MMKKVKVNVSTPKSWDFDKFLKSHSPGGKRVWDEFELFHNQSSGEFDFWLILGEMADDCSLKVKKGNVIFVSMEEVDVIPVLDHQFLEQFDKVISSRSDVKHENLVESYFFTKWHINTSYDQLKRSVGQSIDKTKDLSAIISGKVLYGQHKMRYAYINKLKGHFKEGLDWYCREENPIDDKWDGLAPYKYSIAIENGQHPLYFTEKIVDCILCETIPFYWGAPDINNFFPKEICIPVDLTDFESSIDQIEKTLAKNEYHDFVDLLKINKEKILDEYQFYPWLSNILRRIDSGSNVFKKHTIIAQNNLSFKQRVKNQLKKVSRIHRI